MVVRVPRTGSGSRLTKDSAGALAAAFGAGFVAVTGFHPFVESWDYGWTASMPVGWVAGAVAYRIMLRAMRKLPS